MRGTDLHWVDGPWRGRLALAARPRGGEWLEEEMAHWRREGVDTVLSLLETAEAEELDLAGEELAVQAEGMRFRSFPIPDRQVPRSEGDLAKTLASLQEELESDRNVVVHCRQGIGRTGVVGACLLVAHGLDPKSATKLLSKVRGLPMPETAEQLLWIEAFAQRLAPTR